jgi:chloramphenicol 3-O-phosphotransferase
MESKQDAEAVLIAGVFGSGKTSVAVEIADVLEKRHAPYAVLDLDWLAWFGTGDDDDAAVHRMLLTNLASVTANYRAVGIRFFILARAIRNGSEVDGLRAMLAMPLRVVRLTLPLDEIERRLRSDVTTGRQDDLREAATWISDAEGVGIEDLAIANDLPVRQVAMEVLDWLGWLPSET